MSRNGGYKIIDFKDVNIQTGESVVVAGTYESIESSYRKALMISGVTIDGVEKNDCFVDCAFADNSFTFSAYGKTFTITNDDTISLT